MKRKCTISPNSRRTSVKASTDRYVSLGRAKAVQKKLQEAYDLLEGADAETFESLNGGNIMEELDFHIRYIASILEKQ